MTSILAALALGTDPSARFEMLPIKDEGFPSYRIVLGGKKTSMVLDRVMGDPRILAGKTTSGLTYGTAEGDFSGAFSGSRTIAFAKLHGKIFSRKDYEVAFARGKSVIFKPHQQMVFKSYLPAYLFSSGRYYSLGEVYDVTGWTSRGIEGYYYVMDDGKPYSGHFNFDVENAVFKQDLVIHRGVRTLTTKTLVKKRS